MFKIHPNTKRWPPNRQQPLPTAHCHQPTTTAAAHNPRYNSKQNQTNPTKYPKQIHLQKYSLPPQKFQPPPWYNNNHNPKPKNPIWKITQDLPLWVAKTTQPNHHRTTITQPPSQSITINPTQPIHTIKPRKPESDRKKERKKKRKKKKKQKGEASGERRRKRGKESDKDEGVAEKERRKRKRKREKKENHKGWKRKWIKYFFFFFSISIRTVPKMELFICGKNYGIWNISWERFSGIRCVKCQTSNKNALKGVLLGSTIFATNLT